MEVRYVSNSLEDTKKLALTIGKNLFRGSVISLNGDLGAGKTTFTQSLALSLGIEDKVSSPTFNILKCYYDIYTNPKTWSLNKLLGIESKNFRIINLKSAQCTCVEREEVHEYY